MRKIAGHDIEPWDYLYYAEKVRKAKYDLDQPTRSNPTSSSTTSSSGAFYMAEPSVRVRLRSSLAPGTPSPVFHPDVEVFEVKDKASGRHVGLFYSDDFARPGKRSGAWMTTYRAHSTYRRSPRNVLASNNNNFIKAEAGQPLLISLDDAQTLFHEFGHALHYLSSDGDLPGRWATRRATIVEYPSQVHEHWVLSRPILDGFMKHVETGQPMPQSLVAEDRRFGHLQPGLFDGQLPVVGHGRHGPAHPRRSADRHRRLRA